MGFEIISPNTTFDFLKYRKLAYILSAVVILLGIGSLIVQGGPKYGVDFAGGLTIQLKFDKEMDAGDIKSALSPVGLEGLVVQRFGQSEDNEYLVRASGDGLDQNALQQRVEEALSKNIDNAKFEVQRMEMVGPKVGADLRSKAMEAIFYAVLFIAIYISGRFEQRWMAAGLMAGGLAGGLYILRLFGLPMGYLIFAALALTIVLCFILRLKYALGAVVADMHDIIITIGIFSLLGKEFDLTIVAALLTILGYSLNDTIIVFDRIRENLRGTKSPEFGPVINKSINQTLSRTILTSGTTMLVLLCLFFFGGGVIHDFALAMIIGIVTGTYSSIFVASPILLDLGSGLTPRATAENTEEATA
ncbi:protein translocase subunit SecF [Desulfovibrio inopinatus]|uniref:protein translocase subunit SecF n=1 Tax=Desulfovibrio inopinatus TaxID=102109 RepID=UPI000405C914|nr:protein translocase subunit SecF [Desulfovibrio inopinatus]